MSSESQWLTYLATLPHDQAEQARHIIERCSSVIAGEQQRHLHEEEQLRSEIAALRRELVEIRAHVGPALARAVGQGSACTLEQHTHASDETGSLDP